MFQPLFVRPLTEQEKETLNQSCESSNKEESNRAEVILLSAAGRTAIEISHQLGSHPTNIKKWIKRFNTDGLAGIAIRKRGPQGGPRPRFTSDQIERIRKLATSSPMALGYSFQAWSPQKIARAAVEQGIVDRISHVTVRHMVKRIVDVERPDPSITSVVSRSEPGELPASESSFNQGEIAFSESRYEAAAGYFYQALEQIPDAEREATTRSLLSRALEELSRYEEAHRVIGRYEDARALSGLSPRARARVKLRLGWVNSFLRNHPKAIASLNEARRLFLEQGDDLGVGESHYALGRTYIEINEFRIARDHLVAATNVQRTALDRELLAQIYRRLGMVDFSEGAFSSSKEHYLKALELAEGSRNINLIGGILLDLGTTIFRGFPGENSESARYIERAIEYLDRGGHKDHLALAYNNLGDNLRYSGSWEQAIESLNKAIEVSQRYSKPDQEATARITLAEILCCRGAFDGAELHLKRSLELIEGSGDKWLESNALRILGVAHRGTGRTDAALRTLRQTMQLSTSIGDLHGVTLAMVGLAEFHISQGGHDQAREYLELAQGRLKEEMYLPVSGLIQRLTGQLEAASGRLAEARQHIAQSISIFTTTEIPYDLARSYYEMGILLKKFRDFSGAESNLLEAQSIFSRLGADPDVEVTRKALASVADGEEGVQGVKVSPLNDVLLMQRLIEASATRELLVQELAAVVYENFSVDGVIVCKLDESDRPEMLAIQGMERAEAGRICASLDVSFQESARRFPEGYLIRMGDNVNPPIAIYIRSDAAFDVARLQPLLKQAELGLETCSLRAVARSGPPRNREQRVQTIMPGFLIGSSPMFDVIDKIYKIRTSDVTVLITGESGTGKELVARYIHGQSARARAIFLPFNCTATPKELIDSQLFGHRRGAFTGATTNYPGIIRAADGGTLFLDEIGDLALEVQPKLMRFLQEGEIQPLGETKPVRVDVRIVAATNSDLERAVDDGRFREDLFHRLNVIRIHVPALRDRREEVPVLAAHFLDHFTSRSGKPGVTMTQEAIDALTAYAWPGNVRQLRNEMERVIAYAGDNARISIDDLSPEVMNSHRSAPANGAAAVQGSYALSGNINHGNGSRRLAAAAASRVRLKDATAALEKELISEALIRNRNNLSRTAVDLGLSRRGLRLKLAQLGIEKNLAV
jgi:hydrogenase-4 transcriptional activator